MEVQGRSRAISVDFRTSTGLILTGPLIASASPIASQNVGYNCGVSDRRGLPWPSL